MIRCVSTIGVLVLLWATSLCLSQPAQPQAFDVNGTVTDALGNAIKKGEVHVSFVGGKIGDFKKMFDKGSFGLRVPVPTGARLPLMFKLTFYVDDPKGLPPRWIEHLSPRLPAGDSHRIHVVLYTDDQLKFADMATLRLEGEQLEMALIAWMQADKDFQGKYRSYFAWPILDGRRRLLYSRWRTLTPDQRIPLQYWEYLQGRLKDGDALATEMSRVLPKE